MGGGLRAVLDLSPSPLLMSGRRIFMFDALMNPCHNQGVQTAALLWFELSGSLRLPDSVSGRTKAI